MVMEESVPLDASSLHESRLIVKGLPKHCDERRLREHFELPDDYTDRRLVSRPWSESSCPSHTRAPHAHPTR